MSKWKVTYDQVLFIDPLLQFHNEKSNSHPLGEKETEQLDKEIDECENFLSTLETLSSSNNPLKYLVPVPLDSNLYTIREGDWVGYFFVDENSKMVFGAVATFGDIQNDQLWDLLDEAIKRRVW